MLITICIKQIYILTDFTRFVFYVKHSQTQVTRRFQNHTIQCDI